MLSSTHVTVMDVAAHKIGTSPYFYVNQRHIHLKYLHPFWPPVYFTVPAHERKQGKLGQARALKGFFVGYSYAKYLQPCYRVVAKYANGTDRKSVV